MSFWWKAAARLPLDIRSAMERARNSIFRQVQNPAVRSNSGRLSQKKNKSHLLVPTKSIRQQLCGPDSTDVCH
jgi:hypothetical protein